MYSLDPGTPECSAAVAGLVELVKKLAAKKGEDLNGWDVYNICCHSLPGFRNETFELYPGVFDASCTCTSKHPDDYTAADHAKDCQLKGPAFHYGDVVVRWYKNIGRGMTANKRLTADELTTMLIDSTASLSSAKYVDGQMFEPDIGICFEGWFVWWELPDGPTGSILSVGLFDIMERLSERPEVEFEGLQGKGAEFSNETFQVWPYSMDQHECLCEGPIDPQSGQKHEHGPNCPTRPNFRCGDIEVQWYKTIGRGMSINRIITQQEARNLMRRCLESLD